MESVLGLVRHPGNDGLFQAVEMSILSTLAGRPLHIHAEGLRGTGKTTIMRRVRRILPRIRRIRGCLYNCDPAAPHCPEHRGLSPAEVAALGEERVPMPFLEISHAAKIGTVVGSIDLSRLVRATEPEAALLPGTIPQAHRGIIFVDEINRLAETSPELADVLLDVMGTKPGRVQIEETGLPPVELPVLVSVWAASNPDEDPGPLEEIRRQLSDRFDLAIYTDRPGDPGVVEQILAAMESPGPALPGIAETQAELWRTRVSLRLAELRKVQVPPALRREVAALYSKFELESLRAVQAIQTCLQLAACLDNRKEAQHADLLRVAPMALRHRVDPETLRRITSHLAAGPEPAEVPAPVDVQSRTWTRSQSQSQGVSFGGVLAESRPAPAGRAPEEAVSSGAELAEGIAGRAAAGSGTTEERSASAAASARAAGAGAHAGAGRHVGGGRLADGASWLRRALSHLGFSRALPDPAQLPPQAPPLRARPITALRAEEWVRTEEELGRL
ncbi:magnesium chelatase subunit I [Symbiobacterium terraclitae]|jgi:magnesium chelatase subunit I|uniref:Magnesium chelatase subunit I n=1 Tax=Symbiobacterium terraclitae TaxID=557451 RepID=A0ABS4JRU0_9FIRM|nr:magnesium chelatase [Symbiobacterium terraclitae]MBP2018254.1 magnesium chelatase subunit I [Symbiobacterium terraclitae]